MAPSGTGIAGSSSHECLTVEQESRARHCHGSAGYLLTEKRSRLKKEWEGKNINALMATLSQEEKTRLRADMQETHTTILLAHLGDTPKLTTSELSLLNQAPIEHLVIEATLLDPADAGEEEKGTHSTLEESLQSFRQLQVEHLLLNHFSPRYSQMEITKSLGKLIREDEAKQIHLLRGQTLLKGEDLIRKKNKCHEEPGL